MGWNHPPGLVLVSAPEVKAVGLPIYHTGVEAERGAVGSDDVLDIYPPGPNAGYSGKWRFIIPETCELWVISWILLPVTVGSKGKDKKRCPT